MKDLTSSCLTDTTADDCLSALSLRFASRGLTKSVLAEAEAQVSAEEKTRESAPCSYRLSLLSDAAVKGRYRRGKETMSGEDLLRYVEESRELRAREKDFSDCQSVYEEATLTEPMPRLPAQKEKERLPARLSNMPRAAVTALRKHAPNWFDFRSGQASEGKRTFPFSSVAAILAITVSMMLIVTSALMVAGVETEISELNSEISELSAEVKDLESKLESRSDLLEIRRIAIEELGMVEGEYVRMEHLSSNAPEKIEAFERENNRELTLSAILSAIGLKK